MVKIIVIHGCNLNFLGTREPEVYGSQTATQMIQTMQAKYQDQVKIEYYQTNSEGTIIDYLQKAYLDSKCAGIVINPAAYSHTSIAILDCYYYKNKPVVEVHLSNYRQREAYRQKSLTAQGASAEFYGQKEQSYYQAIDYILKQVNEEKNNNG